MDFNEASQLPPELRPKTFKPDELRQALMPTLEKLYEQDPESLPFRQPVDFPPQCSRCKIPNHSDIIKRPMDLSTIKRKLVSDQYQDPWQFVGDVWLMFDNAWLYLGKPYRVYRHCSKLAAIFEQEIGPVMQSLGYCYRQKCVLEPQVLRCYGKELCTIPRDATYWSYQNRYAYTYCLQCFSAIEGDTVSLGDDPTQPPILIRKDHFMAMKNERLEQEPFPKDEGQQELGESQLKMQWIGCICNNIKDARTVDRQKRKSLGLDVDESDIAPPAKGQALLVATNQIIRIHQEKMKFFQRKMNAMQQIVTEIKKEAMITDFETLHLSHPNSAMAAEES